MDKEKEQLLITAIINLEKRVEVLEADNKQCNDVIKLVITYIDKQRSDR